MPVSIVQEPTQRLEALPVAARPRIDPADVEVPEGFTVEVVAAGLTYPNSLAFSPEGTLFVCEGGYARPLRPFLGARVLAVEPSGRVQEVVHETEAPIMGIAYRDGGLYAALDGHPTRIARYDVGTGRRETLVEIPVGGGIHPINGPVFGPDGLMYFGQGTVSLNGVNGPEGFAMGPLMKNPGLHDVPGEDITLTGHNFAGPNPTAPFPAGVHTGGFKPYGTKSRKGEVVEGKTLCTSSILRANPDGSDVELVAWGIREGYGMAFDERGELYVGDNDMDDHGLRPVGQDPERLWHVKNAKRPHGSVTTPAWYGWPDYCGDGKRVSDPSHKPTEGPPAEPLIENPPRVADKAVALFEPHVGVAKMDFSRSQDFGHRGDLFVSQVGSFAPRSTPDTRLRNNGFQVARVDVGTGDVTPFLRNRTPGPAHLPGEGERSAGIERPVDCKFGPDGKSLYVLDVGRLDASEKGMWTWGRTGVLWRVRPEAEVGA